MLSHDSHVRPFVMLWTVACQTPLSVEILQARILEWFAVPSSRGFPNPRIKPVFLMFPALAGKFFTKINKHRGEKKRNEKNASSGLSLDATWVPFTISSPLPLPPPPFSWINLSSEFPLHLEPILYNLACNYVLFCFHVVLYVFIFILTRFKCIWRSVTTSHISVFSPGPPTDLFTLKASAVAHWLSQYQVIFYL